MAASKELPPFAAVGAQSQRAACLPASERASERARVESEKQSEPDYLSLARAFARSALIQLAAHLCRPIAWPGNTCDLKSG